MGRRESGCAVVCARAAGGSQAGVPVQPIYQGVPASYPIQGVQQPRRSGMKISGIITAIVIAAMNSSANA